MRDETDVFRPRPTPASLWWSFRVWLIELLAGENAVILNVRFTGHGWGAMNPRSNRVLISNCIFDGVPPGGRVREPASA